MSGKVRLVTIIVAAFLFWLSVGVAWYRVSKWEKSDEPLSAHTVKNDSGCKTYYLDRKSYIDGTTYKQTLETSECGKTGIMSMKDNHFLYFVVETSDGTKHTYKTTVGEYKKWMENMKGEWQEDAK